MFLTRRENALDGAVRAAARRAAAGGRAGAHQITTSRARTTRLLMCVITDIRQRERAERGGRPWRHHKVSRRWCTQAKLYG